MWFLFKCTPVIIPSWPIKRHIYLWIGQHSAFSKQAKPTLKPTKSLSKPSTTTTPRNWHVVPPTLVLEPVANNVRLLPSYLHPSIEIIWPWSGVKQVWPKMVHRMTDCPSDWFGHTRYYLYYLKNCFIMNASSHNPNLQRLGTLSF